MLNGVDAGLNNRYLQLTDRLWVDVQIFADLFKALRTQAQSARFAKPRPVKGAAERESLEESGYRVRAVKLLALLEAEPEVEPEPGMEEGVEGGVFDFMRPAISCVERGRLKKYISSYTTCGMGKRRSPGRAVSHQASFPQEDAADFPLIKSSSPCERFQFKTT